MHLQANTPVPAGPTETRCSKPGAARNRSLARDWRRWSVAERIACVGIMGVLIGGNIAGAVGSVFH
jgi:hypothetical protein